VTYREVRAILGEPWHDSLLDPEGPGRHDMVYSIHSPTTIRSGLYWMGSNVGSGVIIDERQGRVVFSHVCTDPDCPRCWLPAPVWRRLRARLGW
jgi:hypothetical protein